VSLWEYIRFKLFHIKVNTGLLLFRLNLETSLTCWSAPMAPYLAAAIAIPDTFAPEEPELKRVLNRATETTSTLSEWERARETSKTWSMEQD
jgi:hypothetical protein